MTQPPAPPRLLVAVSAGVVVLATALAVAGAWSTGVTTDEPIHVMRLRNFLDTGWYALDWDYAGAGPGSNDGNVHVYGPVAMLLLHGWTALWGVEGWGDPSTSAAAYQARHLGVVLIGLVGVVATAAVGRLVLRSWRWGLVAAATLAAVPLWTGSQMVNVKDTPVATGHTLVTLGLLLFLGATAPSRRRRLARGAVLAAGLVLTLGTRPGMWVGLAVLTAAAVGGVLLLRVGRRHAVLTLAELAGALAVAGTALVALYPHLFGHPLRALPRSTGDSSGLGDGASSSRLYVPHHLAEDLPTLLLLFMLSGAAAAVVALVRAQRDRLLAGRLALVGVQAFALPVAAMVLGSDLYHGLRQLLFAVPALAVLAACGMAWWLDRPGVRRRPALLAVTAATALALPMVDQATLQPYQTTYVSLAADVISGGTPADRPGGDYWRASIPELVDEAALDHQLLCKAVVNADTGVAYPFANAARTYSTSRSTDCREEVDGPLAPAGLPVVRELPVRRFDAVFIGPLPANCWALREVTRWRHGYEVVLSTLARCRVRPAPLTEIGVRADDPALGTTTPGDLWLHATDGWVQWPGRAELTSSVPAAGLAFRPGPACRAGCVLVLEGTGPADLLATVDGAPTPISRDAGGVLRVTIPAVSADPVWVRLTRAGAAPLDLRLTGLSLVPRSRGGTT